MAQLSVTIAITHSFSQLSAQIGDVIKVAKMQTNSPYSQPAWVEDLLCSMSEIITWNLNRKTFNCFSELCHLIGISSSHVSHTLFSWGNHFSHFLCGKHANTIFHQYEPQISGALQSL